MTNSQKYVIELEVFTKADVYLDIWDAIDGIDHDMVYTITEVKEEKDD